MAITRLLAFALIPRPTIPIAFNKTRGTLTLGNTNLVFVRVPAHCSRERYYLLSSHYKQSYPFLWRRQYSIFQVFPFNKHPWKHSWEQKVVAALLCKRCRNARLMNNCLSNLRVISGDRGWKEWVLSWWLFWRWGQTSPLHTAWSDERV